MQIYTDWTERPRDKWDISVEQTEHVHGRLQSKYGGVPSNFVLFYCFIFPVLVTSQQGFPALLLEDPILTPHLSKEFWEKLSRGVSKPILFGKGPDCVADPFLIVPRRCFCQSLLLNQQAEKEEKDTSGTSRRVPGQIGKIPENRESPKKDKKGRTSPDREARPFEPPPPPFSGP